MPERHERQTFEVNGRVYDSLDDVPQPYRDSIAALMADRDGNGVPDAFDAATTSHRVVHHDSIDVDGVSYASIDEVPEPARSAIRRAIAEPRASVPDVPAVARGHAPSPTASGPEPIVRRAGWSSRTKLLVGMVAVDVIVAVVVVWLLVR